LGTFSGIRVKERAPARLAIEPLLTEKIMFGDRLKQAREEQGVTLDAIAEETLISRRYLDALERGDLEALPGGAFNKGYIRTIALCLGIDPQPILEAYRMEEQNRGLDPSENEQQMLEEMARLVDDRTKRRAYPILSSGGARVALAITFLVVVSGGLWFWFATRSGSVQPTIPESVSPPEGEHGAESADLARIDAPSEQAAGTTSRPEPPIETSSAKQETTPNLDRAETARSHLSVSESGVGTGVVDRQLIGQSDSFPEGAKVWFWTRVVKGESGDVLRHIWLYEGQTVKIAELTVGGPHWRTYSVYDLAGDSAGRWVVEARDSDGQVLAREEFFCQPKPSQTRR
jgi:cytoskeleton protein RodZ